MSSLEHLLQPCLSSASLMGLLDFSDKKMSFSRSVENTRESVRIAGFFDVDLIVNGEKHRCITHNLSYNGLFIETGRPWKIGLYVTLVIRMTSPAVNIQVDGIIIRNSPHGIGVRLIRN